MGQNSSISWTDSTWNPIRGCSRVSVGAEARWTGEVRFVAEHLADPLKWRKPRRIFVNSMSDLFHESLTNEQIAAIFGVMAAAPQHTFLVLTKHAKRMREWFAWRMRTAEVVGDGDGQMECVDRCMVAAANESAYLRARLLKAVLPERWRWPLSNVHLGVSVED